MSDSLRPAELRELDELIPPPMRPWQKLLIALVLIGLGIGWMVLYIGGWVVPRNPSDGYYGAQFHVADREEGLLGLRLTVPNHGRRDLRLTDVEFDAPGVEVVRVEVIDIPRPDPVAEPVQDGTPRAVQPVDLDAYYATEPAVPFPVDLPATDTSDRDEDAHVIIWLRPTSCVDPSVPWGKVSITLDFGEGAFPPLSKTYRGEWEAWSPGELMTVYDGSTSIRGEGPLSLACEVAR